MSDLGTTAFPSQTMVECGICGEIFNVPWFCKNCAGSLCDTCKQNHQIAPLFKKHIVVPRTVDVLRLHGPAKIAEVCKMHSTKEISTYCNDCKIPCCVLCMIKKHNRHSFSSIEDIYLTAEINLDQYIRGLETNVKPALDEMKENIMKHQEENKVRIEDINKEINTLRFTLKQKVDDSCNLLLQELDQSKVDFTVLVKKIQCSRERVDKLVRDIQFKIREGKLDIIEYSPPDLKDLIPESSLSKIEVSRFIPGSDLIEKLKRTIGRIEFSEEGAEDEMEIKSSPTWPDVKKTFSGDEKGLLTIKILEINTRSTSLTAADNNSAWIMYDECDTIYLYHKNGDIVRSVKVQDSQGINDMVIARSLEMIVTCRDRKLRRVKFSGTISTLIDTAPFDPEGVCLTDKEEVVVCMRGRGEFNHLTVYSRDLCSRLLEIRGINSHGTQLITNPYRIVKDLNYLYVVNGSKNVVCIDDSNFVRWVYDGKQAALRMPFCPRGISVDKYHNLLVTDNYNNCVHYMDREGRLIQVILTMEQIGLKHHWGICVDHETGQVWVGNHLSKVVLSKYLK